MKAMRLFVLFLTLSLSLSALSQEPLVFENQEQQERFNQLTQELRCTVCQNQNLADSDAPLAHDLRDEVYKMLLTGKSNDEIKQFMVQRYGDFVLYRPPVQSNTYLLWIGPLVLLLGGALILRSIIRKRSSLLNTNDTDNDQDTVA
jgi:cytochrome c-type biogenesis protein CcmH